MDQCKKSWSVELNDNMAGMKMQNKIVLIFALIILSPILAFADQGTGSIQIDVKYTNGDRADFYGMVLKIYQDFIKTPYMVIDSLSSNPYNITTLPLGHKYTVEVYVHGMYSSVGYVDLQKTQQRFDTTIPLPGGMRFTAYFKDGQTPIEGATVSVKSQDGKKWTGGITDENGRTIRFWIQSTARDNDYYIVDVSKGGFTYSQYPVKVLPGISQETKVVTPWPSIVNSLIVAELHKTKFLKVDKSDGNFIVELYDDNGNKVTESKVNTRGEAYFTNLRFGEYAFRAIKLGATNEEWGNKTTTVTGNQKPIEIFKSMPQTMPTQTTPPSCSCVAFRLNNLQDYWLNDVQIGVMNTFQKKNADLTVGIISKAFGDDQKIVRFVIEKSQKNNPALEIANNGWKFEDFTTHTKDEQSELIKKANDRISAILGVTPTVFIPPYNRINSDTTPAMLENGVTHISAYVTTDPPPYYLTNTTFYRFPATTLIGFESTASGTLQRITNDDAFASIQKNIHNYGFVVINIQFQDYAVNNGTTLENKPDSEQIKNLESLIDEIQNSGLKIVTIGKINSNVITKPIIPGWIKNNAAWWAHDKISDSDFINGMQYMIAKKIIIIQNLPRSGQPSGQHIPSWIKNNADLWSDDKISDSDFVNGIEFLVKEGIIRT